MKKLLILGVVLVIVFLSVGSALAWRGHPGGHFGIFIGPPVFFFPPPPIYPRYYYPPDYYYDPGYRVWVPGYWDYSETPYGWQRIWIPGHWEWRYDR